MNDAAAGKAADLILYQFLLGTGVRRRREAALLRCNGSRQLPQVASACLTKACVCRLPIDKRLGSRSAHDPPRTAIMATRGGSRSREPHREAFQSSTIGRVGRNKFAAHKPRLAPLPEAHKGGGGGVVLQPRTRALD